MEPDTLVIGASGFIGRRLTEWLGAGRTLSTYCATPVPGGVPFDALRDRLDQLGGALGSVRHAVMAFGATRIDACARNREESAALNIVATRSVVDQLLERGIVPVFVSTDLVFDGARGEYREDDVPTPIVTYGRQKLEIERYLERRSPRHLILRIPKTVCDRPGAGGIFDEWLRAIRAGEAIYCADDHVFSPISLDDVITAMTGLMAAGAFGTYHVGGTQVWNRASLFETFVGALQKRQPVSATMHRCSIRDFRQFAEARPLDVTLSSEKLHRETGFLARDLITVCEGYAEAAVAGGSDHYSKNMNP
jgi:dTDP-4-dehydrorhamnose reductase